MSRKICFVAMGFGKKMDYRNSKEVDLDIIYKKVIKNLFDSLTEYELIRADEISGSEIIDVSMYSLLLKADLVIADITTMNENAIYELGIRHASKPFSTIIMMQESEKIPFDLNHCRILTYKDFGEVLDDEEAEKIKTNLHSFIKASEEQNIDSPLYTYLPNIVPPNISDRELGELLDTAKTKEETISNLVGKAEALKNESKFKESISEWKKLRDILPNNDYVVQQLALVQYKSKYPNETLALGEALNTIQSLNPKKSLDLETIGITGAIYKNLFKLNKNYDYLDEAINYYKKGFLYKSTHNRRERPVHGHRGGSRGRFYYRITTFEGRPWDARDPYKTTFMALKHEIRLSIWRKQKETPGVEKAPGVSSPQRKESGRSGRDDGELRFWVRPGHPRKAVTSISQAEALAHGLTHLHHLVFAAVLARELDWCAALQDAREDARPWGVVGIGLRSDVWVEVRRDDHRPAVLVT